MVIDLMNKLVATNNSNDWSCPTDCHFDEGEIFLTIAWSPTEERFLPSVEMTSGERDG
jgi:hypothetical protein